MNERQQVEFVSSSFASDDELRQTRLYNLMNSIRECQILCKESERSTFIGTLPEFFYAHTILDKMTSIKPVELQKELILELREEHKRYDEALFRRVADLSDKESGWDRYNKSDH